jgi:serine/threonine-protein kinase RsbW
VRPPILRAFAEPAALDQIQQALDTLWAQHPGIPGDIRISLGIAVAEIAANILEHATKGIDRPVQLQMWADVHRHEVLVEFADDGVATLVDLACLEAPHDLAEGGRGLLLSQAVLKHLTYDRNGGVNHWRLVSNPF